MAAVEPLEPRRLLAANYVVGAPTLDQFLAERPIDTSSTVYPLSTQANATTIHVAPEPQVPTANRSFTRAQLVNSTNATTFNRALAVANAGDTIVLRDGTYRDIGTRTGGSNVNKSNLTITAARNARVVVNGTDVRNDFRNDGNNLWSIPFTRPNNWVYTSASPRDIDPNHAGELLEMAFRDGVSMRQTKDDPRTSSVEGASGNAFGTGTNAFFVDETNNRLIIRSTTNPNNGSVEVTERYHGISVVDNQQHTGTTVRGLAMAGFARLALEAKGDDMNIENNVFMWNGLRAVILNVTPGVIVRGNAFVANGQSGLSGQFVNTSRVTAGRNPLVENNYFAHNNAQGFLASWSASNLKFINSRNGLIRNNFIENSWNGAHGYWLDISVNNYKVINNTYVRGAGQSGSPGIHIELAHNITIAFNTIISLGNSGGIAIQNTDSSSSRIYNNTAIGGGVFLRHMDSDRVNGRDRDETGLGTGNSNPDDVRLGAWWVSRDNVVKNNLMVDQRTLLLEGDNVFTGVQDPIGPGEDPTEPINTNNPTWFQHTSTRTTFDPAPASWDHNFTFNPPPTTGTFNNLPTGMYRWRPGANQNTRTTWNLDQFRANTDMAPNDRVVTNRPFVNDAAGNYRINRPNATATGAAPIPDDIVRMGLEAGAHVVYSTGGAVGAHPATPLLPTGWTNGDVGGPLARTGFATTNGTSATVAGNVWTLLAGGIDIWNRADEFQFARTAFNGPGTVSARLESFETNHPWAKAGVMLRGGDGSAANAPFFAALLTQDNGIVVQYRNATNNLAQQAGRVAGIRGPVELRLVRGQNDSIQAQYRTNPDGAWTDFGTAQTIDLGPNAVAGLAATSHVTTELARATFTNVAVTQTPVDTLAPTVTHASFDHAVKPHAVTMTFSEPVVPPTATQVQLRNLTTNTQVPSTDYTVVVNGPTSITVRYDANGGLLPSGDYRLRFNDNAIRDLAGNPLAPGYTFDFWHLTGDINRDRFVDATDFNILLSNYGRQNASYGQGDIDLDGFIGASDFNLLLSHYGRRLTVPTVPTTLSASTFSDQRVLTTSPSSMTTEEEKDGQTPLPVTSTRPVRPVQRVLR